MKGHVVLRQKDLMDQSESVVADGPCLFDGARLLYMEPDGAKHVVCFRDDRVEIERSGQVRTRLFLSRKETGKCVVESDYGVMEMAAVLAGYQWNGRLAFVEYALKTGDEIVARKQMQWEVSIPLDKEKRRG